MPQPIAERFVRDALQNRHNRAILERLPSLDLPDAWLVAGCLFQTVWNLRDGKPPESGIKDYDLFYFDAADLSEEAEARIGERVEHCFRDLGIVLEAKNQARVHTWYPEWFGHAYPPLTSAQDGIRRFLVPCTCVGLQPAPHGQAPVLYAPYGLDDLYAGILRPNPLIDHRELFQAKALSYQERWPWLRIETPSVKHGRSARTVPLRGLRPGDMGWVVEQHGALYAREYGFTSEFEALVAEIGASFLRKFQPEWENAWIAEVDGQRAGSIFVVRKSPTVAKLRMLLLTPEARGMGLGGRLTDAAIDFARARGYRKMVLWTQSNLTAARAIYAARGFQLKSSEPPAEAFGQTLVSETWELKL